MKQKAALLAAALSNLPPPRWDHPVRQRAQIRKGAFPSAEISVPITRKRDTGKMSALVP